MSTKNLSAAITLLLNLTAAAGKVSGLIVTARSEGRDLTDEQLAGLVASDDAARAELAAAIEASRAQAPA